jgi:predicted ester cyclase
MQAVAMQAAEEDVRAFMEEYLASWTGTDENKILAYYSDDIVLHVPTGTLKGKTAVRDNFVRPFITAFPGQVNVMLNLAYGNNLVAVEWSFEGVHAGRFGDVEATGRQVQVPGCSFYEYDLATRMISAGRIYFDPDTFFRQLGAVA